MVSSEPRSLTATKSMSASRSQRGSEEVAADPAEAVDADTNGHADVVLSPWGPDAVVTLAVRPGSDSDDRHGRSAPFKLLRTRPVHGLELADHGNPVSDRLFVEAQHEPADRAARPIAGLIAPLGEIAAVPPRVSGLDGQPDRRPRDVEVDGLARREPQRVLALGIRQPSGVDQAEQIELEAALRRTRSSRGLVSQVFIRLTPDRPERRIASR